MRETDAFWSRWMGLALCRSLAENSEMNLLAPEDSRWKRGKRSELQQEQRTLGAPPAVVGQQMTEERMLIS